MKKIYDIAIIGGGVAGLSSSICSSSEGYSTIILDGNVNFGGQAGEASLIENFIGFPEGVSGAELIKNSIAQAVKFGVNFRSPFKVISLKREDNLFELTSDDGSIVKSKIVILAMGMFYKRLEVPKVESYIGNGAQYGSPSLFENINNSIITVVGGANSAGQACVYLSGCVGCTVNLIVRAESIEKSMSFYLREKIKGISNIKLFVNSEVVDANGSCSLESITLNDGTILPTQRLYMLIGSEPKTDWLEGVELDEYGFVPTDRDLRVSEGLFCAGDVRATSIKRVACASGEGGNIMRGVNQDSRKINEALTLKS